MYFGQILTDKIVQVNDRLRIDASKSFSNSSDAVVSVRIKPEATESFYDAFLASDPSDKAYWFLDWAYGSDGTKTIELEITYGSGPTVQVFTKDIEVIAEAQDMLFSEDMDLIGYQHDVMKYLPHERSSWKFVHRTSQKEILDYLDEKGIVNEDGSKITKDQITDKSEVRATSTFKTLRIIYESMSNAPDDFFMKRAWHWRKYEDAAILRCVERIDFNKDGDITKDEVNSNLMITAGRA
jgi:hypothetical protein